MLPVQALGLEDWFERGLSFLKSQQYEEAIKAFSRAIEINPDCVEAYNNRGIAWCQKGDYDRATANYTKALEINPRCAEVYSNLGAIWFYKGDYDRATANNAMALEINPRCTEAYNNQGAVWFYKGDYERAIANYTRALEINPHCAEACGQLAWILATCPNHRYRNGSRAVALAKKTIALNPKADVLDTLDAAYAEAGQFTDVTTPRQKVITLQKKKSPTEELAEHEDRLKSREGIEPTIPGSQSEGKKVSGDPHSSSKMAFSVQVGAFLSSKNAEKLTSLLTKKGYAARLVPISDYRKRVWHTVRIWDYATRQEAREKAVAFSAKEKLTATVCPIDAF